ncbi:hypothetical protein JIN84_05215 [Luteolibacter yonseiensis]|uniref:Tyr recombinase domain-containing protein n=1 Tax=Luteolibacter yonseiensis TaxID=1144680 RepID=A0A934V9C7_9BACT|nr:site-specific integrase [Luteolibacter yonseiensis]MBK1815003.1 hypothetical protein [Luteolibacter yonseiensis]
MKNVIEAVPCKHPRYSHRVRFYGPDGKRKDRFFTNQTEAAAFAKEQAKETGKLGSDFGFVTEEERAALAYWRAFVEGVPHAPPPSLLSVLQGYGATWKASRSSVTVAAALDAYEVAKTAEGLRPMSLQGIRTRCGRFAKDFGPRVISSITTAEISDWILSLSAIRQRGPVKRKPGREGEPAQVGLLAKRNHRLAVSGLFNYAKTRGWVENNPVTDAARPKPPKVRPGILRPADVARLFDALEKESPALVPFWAVRFFSGVREAEAVRMDWSMIDLAAGEIHLPDTVTKTGNSRTLKIEPVLAAFLTPHAQTDGALVTRSAMARRYHLAKATNRLKVEDEAAKEEAVKNGEEPPRPFPSPMPANAARHSFATFHLLAFRHAGETSIQLGHGGSPELLHRHYKGISTEAEAKAFWAIRPTAKTENVTNIKTGRRTA